jgi:pimeloyl-ACP methyl ester carboxylesterase
MVRAKHAVELRLDVYGHVVGGLRRTATDVGGPVLVYLHGGGYTASYFDVPGYSALEVAAAAGLDAVALDRPGYRHTDPLPRRRDGIVDQAAFLTTALEALWIQHQSARSSGVVLVGHSIGAAVAVLVTARAAHLRFPLLGLALSGIGSVPYLKSALTRTLVRGTALAVRRVPRVPTFLTRAVLFGPAGSFAADAPARSHAVAAPGLTSEAADMYLWWPGHFPAAAAEVAVPVLYLQSEYDSLWSVSEESVREFAAAFARAPRVAVEIVKGAGHAVDQHYAGARVHAEYVAFAAACSTL